MDRPVGHIGLVLAALSATLAAQSVLAAPAHAKAAGTVITDFGTGFSSADAVAFQADGRIVVVGRSGDLLAMARYNSNGLLDTTFDGDGRVTVALPGATARAAAVAIQADGRIVVGGTKEIPDLEQTTSDFALFRFMSNGSLDPSFGTGGIALTNFVTPRPDVLTGLVIQPDGRLVAAGTADGDFAAARYNTDGSPDTTFSTDGKVVTDFAGSFDSAQSVALQADGRIVLAGQAARIESGLVFQNFGLVRYTASGSLDSTFGTAGKVVADFADSTNGADAVALQSNGQIVAAGHVVNFLGTPGGFSDIALMRFNTDGSLDANFGTNGRVRTNYPGDGQDRAQGVAVQTDGRIVAAGLTETSDSADFALTRYDSDGALDTGFGTGGLVNTDFGNRLDTANALALDAAGHAVAVGRTFDGLQQPDFALARYNGDGSLDTAFGS